MVRWVGVFVCVHGRVDGVCVWWGVHVGVVGCVCVGGWMCMVKYVCGRVCGRVGAGMYVW